MKHRQSDSPVWADLLKVRDLYVQGRSFIIGNGKSILFWKDRWLGDQPLMNTFPDLFKMTKQPSITLAEAKCDPANISFSRWLVDDGKNNGIVFCYNWITLSGMILKTSSDGASAPRAYPCTMPLPQMRLALIIKKSGKLKYQPNLPVAGSQWCYSHKR